MFYFLIFIVCSDGVGAAQRRAESVRPADRRARGLRHRHRRPRDRRAAGRLHRRTTAQRRRRVRRTQQRTQGVPADPALLLVPRVLLPPKEGTGRVGRPAELEGARSLRVWFQLFAANLDFLFCDVWTFLAFFFESLDFWIFAFVNKCTRVLTRP